MVHSAPLFFNDLSAFSKHFFSVDLLSGIIT